MLDIAIIYFNVHEIFFSETCNQFLIHYKHTALIIMMRIGLFLT